MIFHGRKRELAFLKERWGAEKAEFVILWGKRRVGKTELVKQFIKGKPHIYFLADRSNEIDQLKRLTAEAVRSGRGAGLGRRGFASWEEVFEFFARSRQRMVLVIDEFLIGSSIFRTQNR